MWRDQWRRFLANIELHNLYVGNEVEWLVEFDKPAALQGLGSFK